jgi:hypothetical protein
VRVRLSDTGVIGRPFEYRRLSSTVHVIGQIVACQRKQNLAIHLRVVNNSSGVW